MTRTAELDQAREALREIVSRFPRGCGVIHGNHPQGWTCLDIVEDAEEHPEKYSVSHRARILGGSYICEACVARAALTGGPQPRSALDARYHVPRSQVWKGSRGRQHGLVHLHVAEPFDLGRIHREPGEALCGRRGWYERPAGGEALCPRCEAIRDRTGRA